MLGHVCLDVAELGSDVLTDLADVALAKVSTFYMDPQSGLLLVNISTFAAFDGVPTVRLLVSHEMLFIMGFIFTNITKKCLSVLCMLIFDMILQSLFAA